MKLKLFLVVLLTSFVFTNAYAQKINVNEYNKLIKKENMQELLIIQKTEIFQRTIIGFLSGQLSFPRLH